MGRLVVGGVVVVVGALVVVGATALPPQSWFARQREDLQALGAAGQTPG